jgi:hypothetical protein
VQDEQRSRRLRCSRRPRLVSSGSLRPRDHPIACHQKGEAVQKRKTRH